MTIPLIEATGLTKILCKELKRSIWYGTLGVARELAGRPRQNAILRSGEFRALDGVSFKVMEGESLGLVGRNGAGKTTLLRILSGLLTPDDGHVTVRGRVGALIALGAGFNPLLTGRENIFVNAAILGFSRAQTRGRFDAIVDFAEVHDFIDAPLHTYSSGMQARLGFAVAAQLEPDILLVDEVLAVGDIAFRAKCYLRIAELMANGAAVILVSHQATMLHAVCKTGLLLESGRVAAAGPIEDVMRAYEAGLATQVEADGAPLARATVGSGDLVIEEVRLLRPPGVPCETLETGAPGTIQIRCRARTAQSRVGARLLVRAASQEGAPAIVLDSGRDERWFAIGEGRWCVEFEMPVVCLQPGHYRAKIRLGLGEFEPLDIIEAFAFRVTSTSPTGPGQYLQPGQWRCDPMRDG